jgi:16S rRNA (guanine(966)-N(2))-methyltransferase RsmD
MPNMQLKWQFRPGFRKTVGTVVFTALWARAIIPPLPVDFITGDAMPLRITGGTARGLRLRSPVKQGIRPTADRIRSAVFSILWNQVAENPKVLDLYAGTGSFGIEALSRGAAQADFVEQNRAQCVAIKENLNFTGFTDFGRVYCGLVERLMATVPGPYDLVFIDPPYDSVDAMKVMERLGDSEATLSLEALVCLEHRWTRSPASQYGRLSLMTHRRYGDTGIAIYSLGGRDDDGTLSG